MGNLTTGFKKFLQNKNTVTVVGVILAIVVLYFAYTMRINSAINPISVPYAAEQIKAGTQITESMSSEAVRKRELAPLQKIRDNYEKIILTTDTGLENEYEGIKSLNIVDWLIKG